MSEPYCVCASSDPRLCYCRRYNIDPYDDSDDDRCECSCHSQDEEDVDL